jgi:methylisocitrate lyase
MNAAALRVYRAIRLEGSQRRVVDEMQSRVELYEVLRYHEFERRLDELFGKEETS